ncbi:MAG TPA: hypothetical protein VM285_15830 [Polyangia bacterium]|nr:hypothetical protein [Polyangia bacterium]
MTTRLGRCALALACLLAAVGASAQAEDTAAKAKARKHFDDGVAFFGEDRYPAALAEFMLSYQTRPKTSVLYNIAMCQKAVGNYPAAIATFERYLAENGHKSDLEQRTEIEALLREMRSDLGRVRIAGAPVGTRVRIDGAEISLKDGRGSLEVAPGVHRVLIEAGDGRSSERVVVVARGAEALVDLELPPPPSIKSESPSPAVALEAPKDKAKPAGAGRVRVTGDLEGRLAWVGGVPVRMTPRQVWLKPGRHEVEVLESGNRRRSAGSVEVVEGKVTSFQMPPPWAVQKEKVGEEGPDPARGAKLTFALLFPATCIMGFSAALASSENREAALGLGIISGTTGLASLIAAIVWGAKSRSAKDAKKDIDIDALLDPAAGTAGLTLGGTF